MSSPRLALALAATTALVLAPLPAFADVHTVKDATHDVVSQGIDDDVLTHPEPAREEGDALAVRVKHGKQVVRMNLQTAQLTRDAKSTVVHSFDLRTNEGRRAELLVYVSGRRWQGKQMWSVNGRDRTCRGLRTHIDYSAGTVLAVVPRHCLSDPRWVRVGAGSGMLTGDRLYADDVSLAGRVEHDLAYGPRIRRG
jgi:hypothetical protein